MVGMVALFLHQVVLKGWFGLRHLCRDPYLRGRGCHRFAGAAVLARLLPEFPSPRGTKSELRLDRFKTCKKAQKSAGHSQPIHV
jgi:hypothetical protein